MVAQEFKNPLLSLLWFMLDPWPPNFQLPEAQPKKKKWKKKVKIAYDPPPINDGS